MTRAETAAGGHGAGGPAAGGQRPHVVDLADAGATDPSLTGGKAAALAPAQAAGVGTLGGGVLRPLGGVVLPTAFCDEIDGGAPVAGHPAVREAFERAGGDERDLVARSSSVVEDTAESSMAGQFASVIGVHGLDAFTTAVEVVLESREQAGGADSPIAVLVQPLLDPAGGGVMF